MNSIMVNGVTFTEGEFVDFKYREESTGELAYCEVSRRWYVLHNNLQSSGGTPKNFSNYIGRYSFAVCVGSDESTFRHYKVKHVNLKIEEKPSSTSLFDDLSKLLNHD